jgi:acetylglutamate kinase
MNTSELMLDTGHKEEAVMKDLIVIKCGGSTLDQLTPSFFNTITDLVKSGKKVIIVHGGGPHINQTLNQLNIESTFVNGLRKTTLDVLQAVEMVLCGKVNKALVTKVQLADTLAVGLSGLDGGLMKVEAVDEENLGFVGEPVQINTDLIYQLLDQHLVPVIAPIGMNEEGHHYNVNADSAAAAIARATQAEELVFVTDVDGILKNGDLIESATCEEVDQLIEEGTVYGGMIPKVKAAMKSLTGNVQSVTIMNGKSDQSLFNGDLIGTKISKSLSNQPVM